MGRSDENHRQHWLILVAGYWILDVFGFHYWSIPDLPASSIKHPASILQKRLYCAYPHK